MTKRKIEALDVLSSTHTVEYVLALSHDVRPFALVALCRNPQVHHDRFARRLRARRGRSASAQPISDSPV